MFKPQKHFSITITDIMNKDKKLSDISSKSTKDFRFPSIHLPTRYEEKYIKLWYTVKPKITSEYDQEIPQSQTADNLVAPR